MFTKLKFSVLNLLVWYLIFSGNLFAQTNDDCMACHEDKTLSKVRKGQKVSLFVNLKTFNMSVHKTVKCAACHKDAAVADFPHNENLNVVTCGSCHKWAQMQYDAGIHGQAAKLNEPYAPDCKECHGMHDILSRHNPESRTYKMNIPLLCGKCHKEGAPVARIYNIAQHNILEHYSESIHGKGMYKSGLIVTATCNDCHENHLVLPHTSPNSSISTFKIANTCMKCHARIEEVHKKIIKQELWESKPGNVPSCSKCHPPHKVTIQKTVENVSDQICLKCHEKDNITKVENGKMVSLKIFVDSLSNSVHKSISCTKCHTDVNLKAIRPCETSKNVDCSNCHIKTAETYFASDHGKAYLAKKINAPFCTNCHGTHQIKSRYDDTSPTYRANIPEDCGKCHQKNGKANKGTHLKEVNALYDYSHSVHGKGLNEKGLLVSAVCTDCHTSHGILKESDKNSSVNPQNIPGTCSMCHKSIFDEYMKSEHSIANSDGILIYPSCANCHSAHTISEIDQDKFQVQISIQCGSCHKKLAETFKETYHGKATHLGYMKAARCSDCHGSHNILKVKNPNSMVGSNNIVATCKQCHKNANVKFTGYLTHATHNSNHVLNWTFWGMTSLLLGVFGFFGLHTLLWIPRSISERKKKHHPKPVGQATYIRRFTRDQRVTHIFVIMSFILLALTGMTLKFAYMPWANVIAKIFGGVHGAGIVHRIGAVITFGYFAYHLWSLIKTKMEKKISFKQLFFGKNTLMFNKQDIKDFIATIKWFVRKGPRPQYGRWTYWEKFDYMAVFWGVAVIGFSGLILWIPEVFTTFLPGWIINVAMIIHSDEALLAVGFIFTIHFFNTHLRPEAFPMDTVIFTGHVQVDEYKADRPREYEEMEKEGKLEAMTVKKEIPPQFLKLVKTFGYIFLSLGVILVILIIYSLLI